MLRKLLLLPLFLLLLSLPSLCRADVKISDVLAHLNFHSGIGYDSKAHGVVNTETVRVIGYSGLKLDPSLDAGWASNDKFVIGASISLLNAKSLGIDIPVLDLLEIRPQILYSWGSINLSDVAGSKNSVIYGASIIQVKW